MAIRKNNLGGSQKKQRTQKQIRLRGHLRRQGVGGVAAIHIRPSGQRRRRIPHGNVVRLGRGRIDEAASGELVNGTPLRRIKQERVGSRRLVSDLNPAIAAIPLAIHEDVCRVLDRYFVFLVPERIKQCFVSVSFFLTQ